MARPPDACPYPKPFPADFDECPAFQPRQFIPLDTLYQPLQPVLTCRHLEIRSLTARHRWYGACALGDAAARRTWAEEVGTSRLARIRGFQAEMGRAIRPELTRLWQLKGQQLQAFRANGDVATLTRELRELSDRAIEHLVTFMEGQTALLNEVGLPLSALVQLTKMAFDRFIESRHSAEVSLDVPDSVLAGMSEPVRTFFRPASQGEVPRA
ncbi:MAG: hypothetical protein M3Z11_03850 [Candidatus Dormibacteraeota bacterium]|nr:hypothetical protein [Candidatus Dormibacteraeota bacterium]